MLIFMPKEDSIVGELINFRGLVYSPINEQGVVILEYSKHFKEQLPLLQFPI